MKERSAIGRITDWINKSILGVANIFLLGITILVTMEVISRKLFGVSFVFVTAMTSILFPWLVFLAIILITKDNEHIAVNYFFNKIPGKFKKYAAMLNRLVMLTFSVFMMISSYKLTTDVKDIVIPVLDISRSYLYSSMVIAFFASSIVLVLQLITITKDGKLGGDNVDLDHDN